MRTFAIVLVALSIVMGAIEMGETKPLGIGFGLGTGVKIGGGLDLGLSSGIGSGYHTRSPYYDNEYPSGIYPSYGFGNYPSYPSFPSYPGYPSYPSYQNYPYYDYPRYRSYGYNKNMYAGAFAGSHSSGW